MLSHLGSAIEQASVLAYVLVGIAGVVTSLGPCNLAMVPVVVAFVGGATDVTRGRAAVMSALFALGSAVTFAVLGVLAAVIGGMFGAAHSVLYLLVSAVCISVGLAMVGAIRLPLPSISTLSIAKGVRKGLLGAFLLGLVLGLAGSQCGTPAMVAILSVALAKGKVAYGASLLFAYGVGRGFPIVIAGASADALSRSRALARWSQALERAAGAMMMLAGSGSFRRGGGPLILHRGAHPPHPCRPPRVRGQRAGGIPWHRYAVLFLLGCPASSGLWRRGCPWESPCPFLLVPRW